MQRFINGSLTNIKKKKKRERRKKAQTKNEGNLIKRKRLVDNFLVNDFHVLKENLKVTQIYCGFLL